MLEALIVKPGSAAKLRDRDARDTLGLAGKEEAAAKHAALLAELTELQERLYAESKRSILLVLQGLDASGKDGTIKHVFTGLNPQGCRVTSFKVPNDKEARHDFLWRTTRDLPQRGKIVIFNRSYYEEVLIVRVHPEILQAEDLPDHGKGGKIWQERYRSIVGLERHLRGNGTRIVKFFLHVSKEEQRRRLLNRNFPGR